MLTVVLLLITMACLIAIEGFFSGVEAAVISCDKVALGRLAKTKNLAAVRLLKMLASSDRLVATTLLGTNLCVVGNSVIATVLAVEHLGLVAPAVVTAVLGPLVFLFGELLPKIIFQQKANRLALTFSAPLLVAQAVLSPIVSVLSVIQRRIIGTRASGAGLSDRVLISRDLLASPARDELLSLRRLGPTAISRVIQFSEKRVEDITVDISQVVSVSPGTGASRAMKIALQRGLSRLLVRSGRINNPLGFVHISSLHAAPESAIVGDYMCPLLYVAEAQRCSNVLKLMQNLRVQMAAVVNEYGACVGIVTLEDLIEQIFGEIRDELDLSPRIERHPEEGYIDVDAYIGVTEMRSMLDISFPSGRYETLAGFLIEQFGAIPPTGTVIDASNKRFIITDSDERRIRRVRIVLEAEETMTKNAHAYRPGLNNDVRSEKLG